VGVVKEGGGKEEGLTGAAAGVAAAGVAAAGVAAAEGFVGDLGAVLGLGAILGGGAVLVAGCFFIALPVCFAVCFAACWAARKAMLENPALLSIITDKISLSKEFILFSFDIINEYMCVCYLSKCYFSKH